MNRAGRTGLTLAAILAAGAGGYGAGQRDVALPAMSWLRVLPWLESAATPAASADPAPSGAVIYYRDPDGKPSYAAGPRKADDGRDYLPVHASEDVSFEDAPPKTASADAPDAAAGNRILYYRNPMGLPDTSPVPKKDSMGMDYIPVFEGEEADSDTVKVSLGKLQRTGVKSETVTKRVIAQPVRVPGTVQLDERRIAVVATRSDAFVEKVSDVTTGDRVMKGEPLVRVYSPEIAAAGAQYLTDLSSSERAAASGGARQRLANLGVPDDAIAEIERTRKPPLAITWTAPSDGVVLERNVVNGMKMGSGEVLFRLADISTVWALVDVAERDLHLIAVGQSVTVRPRGFVDRPFTGKVAVIYPQVNRETRTTRVRVELANPDGILRPDMYVDAEIATGTEAPVTAVPTSAVIDSGSRQVVIVDRGEGRFEPRPVKLGRRGTDFVEIREGVSEGDAVVVTANFLIDAESNLKAALRGMTQDGQQEGQAQ